MDYISLPLLHVDKVKEEKARMLNFDNIEMIYNEYDGIEKKIQKTGIEKKLVKFLREKLDNI